jgi:hypothetical protein
MGLAAIKIPAPPEPDARGVIRWQNDGDRATHHFAGLCGI